MIGKIWEGYLNWVSLAIGGGVLGYHFAEGKGRDPVALARTLAAEMAKPIS